MAGRKGQQRGAAFGPSGVSPEELAAKAEARSRAVARQLAALPPRPHRRTGEFVQSVGAACPVDPETARRAQEGRPTHHHASGKPLIDLRQVPSAMDGFARQRGPRRAG